MPARAEEGPCVHAGVRARVRFGCARALRLGPPCPLTRSELSLLG